MQASKTAQGRGESTERPWSIVVVGDTAGGDLRPVLRRWLRSDRWKQLCRFTGKRSMLDHTLARADLVSGPERTVTVLPGRHAPGLSRALQGQGRAWVVQPADRGGAAGILLGLAHVWAIDRGATVVIYPSDHFVYPTERFAQWVRRAAREAQGIEDRILLIGVRPDRFEPGYPWLLVGNPLPDRGDLHLRPITAYVERPGLAEADAALRGDALWSTSVIVGRVSVFRQVARVCFRKAMNSVDHWVEAGGKSAQGAGLREAYRGIPKVDFVREVLARAGEDLLAYEAPDVLWSDWGTAERIRASLARIGRAPIFPLRLLERPGGAGGSRGTPPAPPWMRSLSSTLAEETPTEGSA